MSDHCMYAAIYQQDVNEASKLGVYQHLTMWFEKESADALIDQQRSLGHNSILLVIDAEKLDPSLLKEHNSTVGAYTYSEDIPTRITDAVVDDFNG